MKKTIILTPKNKPVMILKKKSPSKGMNFPVYAKATKRRKTA